MRRPPALQGPQPCLGNRPIMVSVEVDSLRSGMATAAGPKAKGADLFTQGMVWPTEPSGVPRAPGRHPGLSLCSQWRSLRLGPAEAGPGWGLAHVLRVSGCSWREASSHSCCQGRHPSQASPKLSASSPTHFSHLSCSVSP